MNFLVYSIWLGVIIKEVSLPQDQLLNNLGEGESAILGSLGQEMSNYYVVHETGTLHKKADYTLDSLPLPCTITIEGEVYEVNKQPTFDFDAPGTYTIEVDAGPKFLRKEFTIDN